MKELKITKGEWTSIFRNKHDCGIRSDKGFICLMIMPSHYPNQDVRYDEELEECRHDAELIADAGNTAQKCGILPSELLKQRDELLAENKRLKAITDNYNPFSGRPNPRDVNPYDSKAIKRTRNH